MFQRILREIGKSPKGSKRRKRGIIIEGMQVMTGFLSTISSKLDAKGRVSVPVAFRTAAAAQGFGGIYVYPSFTMQAIEGGGQLLMDNVSQMISQLPPYTDERDALATALFAENYQLQFDGDGRVSLPESLLAHAGIEKGLVFVGLGAKFQIWEPSQFATYREKARQLARQHRGLLHSLAAGPLPSHTPPVEEND
ncbi:MAG: hypothetical protein OXT03_06305 [Alphaproteobacteria bacterium]|nr:hypothetical protein [Alphaproteobacteria bacterium]